MEHPLPVHIGKYIGMMAEQKEGRQALPNLTVISGLLASYLEDPVHVDKEVTAMGNSIERFLQQILKIGYVLGMHALMQ